MSGCVCLFSSSSTSSWADAVLQITAAAELWGTITDERERQAVVVAAENVPGVKGARDHLVSIDPASGLVIYSPDDEALVKAS